MSENLKKYFKDMEFISKIKCAKTKQQVMDYMSHDPKVFLALREIALNVIKGNVKLTKRNKTKLLKHRELIYLVAKRKRVNKNYRRQLVVQSGGWMWLLPVISTIIDLIN